MLQASSDYKQSACNLLSSVLCRWLLTELDKFQVLENVTQYGKFQFI